MDLYLDFQNTSIRLTYSDIEKKYTDISALRLRAQHIFNRLKNLDFIKVQSRLDPIRFFVYRTMLSWENRLSEEKYCYILIKYGGLIIENTS